MIAFLLGSQPDLAQKEAEAVATTLPFPWSSSMVAPGVLVLKPNHIDSLPIDPQTGLPSPELMHQLWAVQNRLGGTRKIAFLPQQVAASQVRSAVLAQAALAPAKLDFAVSCIGAGLNPRDLTQAVSGRSKELGTKARFIASKEGNELSTAQTFGNKLAVLNARGLIQSKGREFLAVRAGDDALVGVVLTVQNIQEYTHRDRDIPVPDPISGMLPPKLAQMMVNLGLAGLPTERTLVYDPFCGNGRVLLEASLLDGALVAGSDHSEQQVAASQKNLAWLRPDLAATEQLAWQADATAPEAVTRYSTHARAAKAERAIIVTEPYLGKPLRAKLSELEGQAWLAELQPLYSTFFSTWAAAKLPVPISAILMVMPRTATREGGVASVFVALQPLLASLGYRAELLGRYQRPDAIVARDIVRLVKS